MDTSEIYVNMCKQAEEVQRLLSRKEKLSGAHIIYCPTHEEFLHWIYGDFECVECPVQWLSGDSNDALVWLPRQDQLQELLPEFIQKAGFVAPVASHFADFVVDCANNPFCWNLNTFEQLWLAFVMKERYQKIWSGSEWITQGGKEDEDIR